MSDESSEQRLSETPISRRSALGAFAAGAVLLGSKSIARPAVAGHRQSPSIKRGGTLRVGIGGGGSADTLEGDNAFTNVDWARAVNLFDPLVEITPQFRLSHVLAEELVPNHNASEWTIRVKKGVTFHNGKELTAEDVIFTFRRIWNPKLPLEGAGGLSYVDMKGLRQVDRYTVRVPMTQPLASFPEILADTFYLIVPVGFNKRHPIGTGPFKYKSFTPGQESIFVRNEHYFQTGLPYVDRLVITDFPDLTSRIDALASGTVDCIDQLNGSVLASARSAGGKILNAENASWVPFVMQSNLAPFTDVRVRQAMRLIVDRPAMIRTALDGYGAVGNDYFGRFDPSYDASIPQRHQDIARAKFLLKKAGRSDLHLTLDTSSVVNGMLESAEVFVEQAKLAGVSVHLNNMPTGTYYGPTYLHRAFSQSNWLGEFYLAQVTQSNLPSSPLNETAFRNAHYASLFRQANATLDTAKQRDLIHEMQLIDHNEGGYIVWSFVNTLDAYKPHVHGLVPSRWAWSLGGYRFKEVWLS